MPDKQKVIEELNFLSGQLSKQTRTINIGLIAFIWSLLVYPPNKFATGIDQYSYSLITTAILAIISLIVDHIQYLSGYKLNILLLKEIEEEKKESKPYDKNTFYYKIRVYGFIFKTP